MIIFVIYLDMSMTSNYDLERLEQSTETLRAIAHPIRISIIQLLAESEVLTVTNLHESLSIEQAVASHHLRILKDKGIVKAKRDGKNSLYSLSDSNFYEIVRILMETIQG